MPTYVVKSAVYGAATSSGSQAIDVTRILQDYLNGGQYQVCISNGSPSPNPYAGTPYPPFIDPWPGQTKGFGAVVAIDGVDYFFACSEGATIDFSRTPNNQ